jgi:hypothetical protein
MALVFVQEDTPIDAESYDKVNEVLAAHGDPPEGLIVHTASVTDAGMTIIDVWESQAALDRFRDERLMPAVREVMGEPQGPPPEVRVFETHDIVRP